MSEAATAQPGSTSGKSTEEQKMAAPSSASSRPAPPSKTTSTELLSLEKAISESGLGSAQLKSISQKLLLEDIAVRKDDHVDKKAAEKTILKNPATLVSSNDVEQSHSTPSSPAAKRRKPWMQMKSDAVSGGDSTSGSKQKNEPVESDEFLTSMSKLQSFLATHGKDPLAGLPPAGSAAAKQEAVQIEAQDQEGSGGLNGGLLAGGVSGLLNQAGGSSLSTSLLDPSAITVMSDNEDDDSSSDEAASTASHTPSSGKDAETAAPAGNQASAPATELDQPAATSTESQGQEPQAKPVEEPPAATSGEKNENEDEVEQETDDDESCPMVEMQLGLGVFDVHGSVPLGMQVPEIVVKPPPEEGGGEIRLS
ncbi:unnamed protein product [Amoebophrya sp. A120]|nr:unnamed protein product [Amoebophrya sp. A120]|eukprot:GSA120T00023346001.1